MVWAGLSKVFSLFKLSFFKQCFALHHEQQQAYEYKIPRRVYKVKLNKILIMPRRISADKAMLRFHCWHLAQISQFVNHGFMI
jgi:hypothetical protein